MSLVRARHATGLIAIMLTSVVAHAQAPSNQQTPPKSTSTTPPADNSTRPPSCDKFQEWRYGQECRRNDGKTCQVMGPRADPNELKFCK